MTKEERDEHLAFASTAVVTAMVELGRAMQTLQCIKGRDVEPPGKLTFLLLGTAKDCLDVVLSDLTTCLGDDEENGSDDERI